MPGPGAFAGKVMSQRPKSAGGRINSGNFRRHEEYLERIRAEEPGRLSACNTPSTILLTLFVPAGPGAYDIATEDTILTNPDRGIIARCALSKCLVLEFVRRE